MLDISTRHKPLVLANETRLKEDTYMASDYMLIEQHLRERLKTPLPEYLFRSSDLESRLQIFTRFVIVHVGLWMLDSGVNQRDVGIVSAMEDGITVGVYGLGQVVRQSTDLAPQDQAIRLARLRSGATVLRSLADLDVDTTVAIEEGYGFRPAQFSNPAHALEFSDKKVRLPDLQQPLVPHSERPGGCPFKKNMERLYPALVPAVLAVSTTSL